MLVAGLDGIKNEIDPGDGTDVDLFELFAEELARISTVPWRPWMPTRTTCWPAACSAKTSSTPGCR